LLIDGIDRIKNNSDSALFLSDNKVKTNHAEKVVSKLMKHIPNVIVKDVIMMRGQKTEKTKPN
jgi:septum formation inhibitor MinC